MNKLKLLYDVVTTMKRKEFFKGVLKVEACKDNQSVFNLDNEFEKNIATGQIKCRLKTNVDCDGQQLKHESITEGNISEMHQKMKEHFHNHLQEHCHHLPHCCGGIKDGLTKIGVILNILNTLKVTEADNHTYQITLNSNDFEADFIRGICEHMKQFKTEKVDCLAGIHHLDNFELNVIINSDFLVEKVTWTMSGGDNQGRLLDGTAGLDLLW